LHKELRLPCQNIRGGKGKRGCLIAMSVLDKCPLLRVHLNI
jgi:hypothetical protein